MTCQKWTSEQVEKLLHFHQQGHEIRDIARLVARTEMACRLKLHALGRSSQRQLPSDDSALDLRENQPAPDSEAEPMPRDSFLQAQAARELARTQERREFRIRVDEAKIELLEDRILAVFREHLVHYPRHITIPVSATRSEPQPDPASATAVLVASDWHIGKAVDPRELDLSTAFNPVIAISRVAELQRRTTAILQAKGTRKLIILAAGDLVEGHLGHALEDNLTMPLADQVLLATSLLFQLVVALSHEVESVEVYGVAGNHGRWPGLKRTPADRRYSNLDTIVIRQVGELVRACDLSQKIVIDDRIAGRRLIEVGNHLVQLQHGDEIRGGSYCVTGFQREVTNTMFRQAARGGRAPDYYVIGDKHITASFPVGHGAVIMSGSLVGEDCFNQAFAPSPPSQTLFFVDPVEGKTETHELRLARAPASWPSIYDLPPSLASTLHPFIPTR
ncbi:hypothetical protein DB345_10045 [Spartobacteria bacterium LR76]|nr:hypothetical protein DB345_10045 [Spartobacteria bacterium LR76]